ncbi:MAG: Cysteinyl-tRNA synthetase [Candidatus Magnetoglobus multicellularis str. Araruama]|uniref:Cysteine--tRNA ligase n=1 Tax=Candidatus Magnetoglobus multicellularis str. Araruama TaxID=890399 RepID=A0A1V1PHS4_9BACT|nr:MAG: Cysteinyl-tRNA synthetase [Candidatus Magnetoglobus multicellularis str. Araruama]
MSIQIYNTLHRKKEAFAPLSTNHVNMYVCGPTVYDDAHIGHARSVVVFDMIARYFKIRNYTLTYIRNYTDIDDKIIQRAQERNITTESLAEKYIQAFDLDMDALYVQKPDMAPKATSHIPEIIQLVDALIQKKNAYVIDGDVFFSVESHQNYGCLSGRKLEDMAAGARVNIDPRKRNPHDFALWKSAKPNEPCWDSPWGKGRPGWHIECSAMSMKFLGQSFDIHGGGKDLIFPHHENEIAQSEAANGKTYARYWVHNGFVNINREKMSKSLGNVVLIKTLLQKYPAEAIRLFLLSSHYRSPIDFNDQAMHDAVSALNKLYAAIERIESSSIHADDSKTGALWQKFCGAMDDDFNSAQAIGYVFDAVRQVNRLFDHNKILSSDQQNEICSIYQDIHKMGKVLGLLNQTPAEYANDQKQRMAGNQSVDEIDQLVNERFQARKNKDWARADAIRDQLTAMGITLEDRADGSRWKYTEQ